MVIISDYSDKGVDKAMLVRTVILRTIAGIYNWIQAAEILGYTPRHMSRIKKRYEEYGFEILSSFLCKFFLFLKNGKSAVLKTSL